MDLTNLFLYTQLIKKLSFWSPQNNTTELTLRMDRSITR